jgi:hypothetical protein
MWRNWPRAFFSFPGSHPRFEVITNVYSVTQGRQVVVLSVPYQVGTNTFTGSVFDYYRSDALASPNDIGYKRVQKLQTTSTVLVWADNHQKQITFFYRL